MPESHNFYGSWVPGNPKAGAADPKPREQEHPKSLPYPQPNQEPVPAKTSPSPGTLSHRARSSVEIRKIMTRINNNTVYITKLTKYYYIYNK